MKPYLVALAASSKKVTPCADGYRPKPSFSVAPDEWAIRSDGDIWVERLYMSRTGDKVAYFCSINRRQYHLYEPPTGAGQVIYHSEIHKQPIALQEFARKTDTMELLQSLRGPKPLLSASDKIKKTRFPWISRKWDERRTMGHC